MNRNNRDGGRRHVTHARPERSEGRRRRSFVLILVLVYLTLAASLLLTTAAGTAQLVGTTRREHVSTLLRQLNDSGAAWVKANRAALTQTTKVTLDGVDLVPPNSSAVVTITRPSQSGVRPPLRTAGEHGATIVIDVELRMHGRRYLRAVTLTTNSP